MVVLLLAGIYLLSDGPWKTGDAFIGVGIARDPRPLRPAGRVLHTRRCARRKEIAERDLESGDELSDEYAAVAQRIGKVGSLAGLIVVVTVFFMAYKPFL